MMIQIVNFVFWRATFTMLPMMYQLQQGDIQAWTDVLRRHPQLKNTAVVSLESLPLSAAVSRYTLTLSDHTEPITLLLCEVSAREARFYETFGSALSLVPTNWYSESGLENERGWLVLDETASHYRWDHWQADSWEQVLGELAHFHAHFWQMDTHQYLWLPEHAPWLTIQNPFQVIDDVLTLHRKYGRNNDILDDMTLAALHHLAVEGESLLQPLRNIPHTLLHGSPTPERWHVDMLGACHLLEWKRVSYGPGVLDVATLLETAVLQSDGLLEPHLEEIIVDSYFVQLGKHQQDKQHTVYEPRFMRRHALPAAQCWHIINRWLPRLVYLWQKNPTLSPELEEQISRIFSRLLKAYKLLTTPTPLVTT